MANGAPELSVVLSCDAESTAREVVEAFRRQTAKASIELVLVLWANHGLRIDPAVGDGFAGFRTVEVERGATLPEARAAGTRVARAPLVFFAETHAYPRPEWAAAVLASASANQPCVVSSAFINANPVNAVSWAGFLSDYGEWMDELPRGPIATAPMHKGTFPRDDLGTFGERLPRALSAGDELVMALRERDRRIVFEPAARIDHYNVPRLGLWLRGRLWVGYQIGANRGERWPPLRRAAYAAGFLPIALLLLLRSGMSLRRARQSRPIPAGTLVVIAVGALARAIGEAIGYARPGSRSMADRADAYELRESVYAMEASRS